MVNCAQITRPLAALLLGLAPCLTAAELNVELRLPTQPIRAGQVAVFSAVLSGIEADKLYTLLPPAADTAPTVDWGTLEWGALVADPELRLELRVTATEPGTFEIPSLQVRALPAATDAPLVGEALDLSKAMVVATMPVSIDVSRDWTPLFLPVGVGAGVFLVALVGGILWLRSRRAPEATSTATPHEQAQQHQHAARRQRLDGDFYKFYLSLAAAAKALGQDATALERRAQDVGFKGVRPTEDEMDGALKDIERALTQRNKDS
jgi:hypothetical protein